MSTSQDRLSRLLVMVPWVVEHPGVKVDEVCKRFDVTRQQLVRDINLIMVCGVAPYMPDQLMWADIDGDEVVISPVDYFERPLRLTRGEALRVLAAGRGALDMPGVDSLAALKSALEKVEAVLDESSARGAVDVALNADPQRLRNDLATAISGFRSIEIEYFGVASQRESVRVVDPLELFAHDGRWYLYAWCHEARDYRVFRLDGIRSFQVSEESFDRSAYSDAVRPEPGPGDEAFTVTLRLAPGPMAWFGDNFQLVSVKPEDDGWATVELRAAGVPWITQLLIRMGKGAELVGPDFLKEAVKAEAERILAVYCESAGAGSR
ncbi:MAG: hypothetical protein DCC49_01305 [Acidobacteria bacterium]|nr:MAG: hypothetical protein DCC49_01305 [Acidobacteriota bacterium]